MSLLLNSVTAPSQWDIDPTTIPDCEIWFDAADTDTITGTSPVTAWRNKGRIVMDAINDVGTCTSGSGTINGRNYISCPQGTNLAFTCALTSQAKSVFLVVRGQQQLTTQFFAPITRGTTSTTQMAILFSRSSATSYHYNISLNAWTSVRINAQSTYQTTPSNFAAVRSPVPNFFNTTRVYGFVNSLVANNNCISVNGVEYSPSTTPGTLTTSLSASGYATGNIKYLINNSDTSATYNTGMDFCEIIYYNRALSVPERKTIEGYLAWKWGVVTNENTFTSPLSIPGCLAWHDADVDFNDATSRATSFTFSSGNSVQTWLDKSGNGNTATSATTGKATLNQALTSGKCGVTFLGATTLAALTSTLSLGTTQSCTLFLVASGLSFGTARGACGLNAYPGTAGGYIGLQQNNSNPGVWQWTGGTGFEGFTTGVPLGVGRADVVSAIWTPGSCQYTTNGLIQPTSSTTPTVLTSGGQMLIGGIASGTTISNGWAGNIFEIIVYDGVLSDENRLKVEKYLSLKWNVSYYVGTIAKYHNAQLYKPYNRLANPLDIAPNCAMWLDAADPDTLTLSGSTVTNWRDKSGGNARYPNLVPITGSSITMGTINGLPALYFNGSSGLAGGNEAIPVVNGATSINWFLVASIDTVSPTRPALVAGASYGGGSVAYADAKNALYVSGGNLELKFRATDGGTLRTATTPISASTPFLAYAATFSPVTNQYHIGTNGTKGTTTVLTNFTQDTGTANMHVGRSAQGTADETRLVGYVGEIIGYSTILTDGERQRIEGYLAWKWGLQSLLPGTHPYAPSKPTVNAPKIHPMLIANPLVWLDAADPNGNGILPASGSAVRQWFDKSGYVRTCFQPTAALCPTFTYDGDYPAIQFNGTTQFLQSTSALNNGGTVTTYSAFVVYRPTSITANNVVFFQSLSTLATAEASSVHVRVFSTDAANRTYIFTRYNATGTKESDVNAAATTRTLVSICESGNTALGANDDYFFFKNGQNLGGTATGSGNRSATADNGRYIIGAQCFSSTYGNYFTGNVHEVLFFNRRVSDMERRQIEGYLAWKWGMQTTMTANQPCYKISL